VLSLLLSDDRAYTDVLDWLYGNKMRKPRGTADLPALPNMEVMRRWPYYQEILAQPDAVQATVNSLSRRARSMAIPFEIGTVQELGDLVLTGMGASFYTLYPLYISLIEARLKPILMETSELLHHAESLLTPRTIIIVVSQSGRSAETCQLLDILPNGTRVIGVTNDSESTLAKRAQHLVLTRAGRETSVSSKTYVATLAALEFLQVILLGGETNPVRKRILFAAGAMADYLSKLESHIVELVEILRSVHQIYFTGRSLSLGSAHTAGLITKEAARFPAEGMSSAAFRHGPFEMVGPEVFVMIFSGRGGTVSLNHRLVLDIEKSGGMVASCGMEVNNGPFSLPTVERFCTPMLEILPCHLMILALGALRGYEAGRFQRITKVSDKL
jgi:glucosamine--fructose-6-phosphate aminotransferase (isomerizing)